MKIYSSVGSASSMCSALSGFAAALLLLAAAAAPAGAQVDHFQGYLNAPGFGQPGPIVQIVDQFGAQTTDLDRPIRFLVPVDKNDEGIFDPFSHLTCYQILDGDPAPPVIATNQFGSQPLTLGDPDSLCVPTEKLIFPGPVFLDHYKCYVASGAPVDVGVALQDQFQGRTTLVVEPKLFCTPAEKNGEPMIDPVTHLTCYDTNPISGGPGPIPILNQFTPAPDVFELLDADTLCVPSTKELVPPPTLDHFTLYDATGADGPIVTIDDQFGAQVTDLGSTKLFLVPADKNGEGISDPFSHLTCYEILDGEPGPPNVTVTNQFVTDAPIDVGFPTELCVPTEKLISPGPVDIDHFKCYDAFGDPVDIGVNLADQFQGFGTLVVEPFRLCNPADKNGEGIANPDDHLVCYLLQPPGGFLGIPIPIQNQFFPAQSTIDVGDAFGLCVPSAKAIPEPSFALGLGSCLMLLAALDRRRRRREAAEAAAD
jgi:hypothetical protein